MARETEAVIKLRHVRISTGELGQTALPVGKHPLSPLVTSSNESPEPLPEPETDHWEKFPPTNCCRKPFPSSPSRCPPAFCLSPGIVVCYRDPRFCKSTAESFGIWVLSVWVLSFGFLGSFFIFAVISVPPPRPVLQHHKRSRLLLF